MPVAEILAGIALVKSRVDFIKSNIDTCKDIGELGSAIDGLLRGKDEADRKQNQRGMGVREQFDTTHIARETIDAKLAAEKLQEIATLIDFRFGHGTWKGILEERAKRIQEAREAERKAKIAKRKAEIQMWEDIKTVLMIAGVLLAGIAAAVGAVWYSRL